MERVKSCAVHILQNVSLQEGKRLSVFVWFWFLIIFPQGFHLFQIQTCLYEILHLNPFPTYNKSADFENILVKIQKKVLEKLPVCQCTRCICWSEKVNKPNWAQIFQCFCDHCISAALVLSTISIDNIFSYTSGPIWFRLYIKCPLFVLYHNIEKKLIPYRTDSYVNQTIEIARTLNVWNTDTIYNYLWNV